jgi:hypothetical protein
MVDRTWRDEPPPRRGRYNWEEITADLKRKPGKWALVNPDANPSTAGAIRLRKMTALQDDKWDFQVRVAKVKDEDTDIVRHELWMSAKRKGR